MSDADATKIRAELEALRAAGARTFDPPAFDLVASLAAKADALGGAAGTRLRARAMQRAQRLAADLERARARAAAALASIPNASDHESLARGLETGSFDVILRAARRARAPDATRAEEHATWIARLEAKARARGLHARPTSASPRARAHALAAVLYEASRAEAMATMTALRAEEELPGGVAGPYNPHALAVAALAELAALSPAYLSALVAQLAEIGAFLLLPPVPTAAELRPAAPRRRRPGTPSKPPPKTPEKR